MTNEVRSVTFWEREGGKAPALEYLEKVLLRDPLKHAQMMALVITLAESGDRAFDGRKIKSLRFPLIQPPAMMIEIKVKPYRLYGVLTPSNLCLLAAEVKKTDPLVPRVRDLIVRRAQDVLQNANHNLL